MKSIIIYNAIEEDLQYVILEGDYSRFHGLALNSSNADPELEKEFVDLAFEEETGHLKLPLSHDISLLENKEWDKVVIVTWLP